MSETTGTIAHLNQEGDTKYTWDRKNKVECEAAKEHFDNLRKKGFLAFKVGFLGFRGKVTSEFNAETGALLFTAPQESVKPEMVTEFDPKENYVVTPQIVGG